MKEIKELLKKKALSGEFMDEKAKKAAERVIGDMDDMAEEAMSKSMQKVTVASDTEEGLKEGLEKAEEIIEAKDTEGMDAKEAEADMEGDMMEEKMEDEMMSEKEKVEEEDYDKTPDYEDMDKEDMEDEEIDEMIAMLKEKKQRREMMR